MSPPRVLLAQLVLQTRQRLLDLRAGILVSPEPIPDSAAQLTALDLAIQLTHEIVKRLFPDPYNAQSVLDGCALANVLSLLLLDFAYNAITAG